jgi:hypothetical protein
VPELPAEGCEAVSEGGERVVNIDLSGFNYKTTVYSKCEICGESIYSSPFLRSETPNRPWVHTMWNIRVYNHEPEPQKRLVMIVIETFVNGSTVAQDLRHNPYVMSVKEVKDIEGQDREGG